MILKSRLLLATCFLNRAIIAINLLETFPNGTTVQQFDSAMIQ